MHLNLTQRLFFPILLTGMLVVVIMGVGVRYSFHTGFLEYVNLADVRSMEGLVRSLADSYETENNWDFLRGNQSAWLRLLRSHFTQLEREFRARELEGETGKLMPPGVRIGPRLTLMDKNKSIVIGNLTLDPEGALLPIISNKNIVGWLHINPSNNLTDAVAIQFEEQQFNSGYWIAIICVFLAAGAAMILARHLSVPVKLLAKATRALTSGDYTARIEETRPDNDEMGRLQRDFNSLANTLEKNENTRRQWIADISHELRTPIAVLRGEIEALQDGVRECSKDNLDSLHLEILHVNQIIEDLYQLSMSDIGALDYKKEDVDLSKALDDAVNSYKETLKQQNICLNIDMNSCGATKIFADPQRLYQLFTNFMQNTLRYTNPDGELEIWCEKSDKHITINWRDSAPGVSDELLPQLFVRLFRTEESRCRQTGGAGLGLSICKNIVDAHDGEISVQHSPLGGLWFITKLPTL
ncbi:MAG: ATP-binding protein [Gammaproteobacteria bacterium]|jgi:two-component system sensor histidine kinase BaeS